MLSLCGQAVDSVKGSKGKDRQHFSEGRRVLSDQLRQILLNIFILSDGELSRLLGSSELLWGKSSRFVTSLTCIHIPVSPTLIWASSSFQDSAFLSTCKKNTPDLVQRSSVIYHSVVLAYTAGVQQTSGQDIDLLLQKKKLVRSRWLSVGKM